MELKSNQIKSFKVKIHTNSEDFDEDDFLQAMLNNNELRVDENPNLHYLKYYEETQFFERKHKDSRDIKL